MDLSASAVEQKTFDTIRRAGFDPEQVSAFLGEVAEELARLRDELTQERSRSQTLEQRLEEAEAPLEEDAEAHAELSEVKQRVMEVAERKVLGLLAFAHTEAGHENPEDRAREELAALLEEAEAGPPVLPDDEPIVVAGAGAGSEELDDSTERALAGAHLLLAEASRVPSVRHTEDAAAVAAARDEAERVRLHAKLVHARAEVQSQRMIADAEREASRLEVLAVEHAGDIQAMGEVERVELVEAGEAAAKTLMAEAAKLMDEAKSLPERFAGEAEALVAEAQEQAESIRLSAWKEAEQAQEAADVALQEALLEAQEVRRQTSGAVDDAEAHAARVLSEAIAEANEMRTSAQASVEAAEADLARGREAAYEEAASIVAEAEQRVEELSSEIARLESERDRLAELTEEAAASEAIEARARALEEVEAAEAEISELLATARADAAAVRSAAADEGAGILEEARAGARRVIDDARIEAEHALRGARLEHQDLVARLRSLKLIIEELQQRLPDLALADGGDAVIINLLDEASAAAVDLRHRLDGIDDDWEGDLPPQRASRYSERSAGLPSMGHEEADKALDGLAAVRVVEPDDPPRKGAGRDKGQHLDVADSDEESA